MALDIRGMAPLLQVFDMPTTRAVSCLAPAASGGDVQLAGVTLRR